LKELKGGETTEIQQNAFYWRRPYCLKRIKPTWKKEVTYYYAYHQVSVETLAITANRTAADVHPGCGVWAG
jgi:hypothetical protein